jgi:hypothetical protein
VFCNTVIPLILLPAAISAKLLWVVEGMGSIEIKEAVIPSFYLFNVFPLHSLNWFTIQSKSFNSEIAVVESERGYGVNTKRKKRTRGSRSLLDYLYNIQVTKLTIR